MPRGIPKWMNDLTKEEREQTRLLLALEKEERDKEYRKEYYKQKKLTNLSLKDPPCKFSIQRGSFNPFREDRIREGLENTKFN